MTMDPASPSIDSTRPTVVEVWSPTCAECRAMQADLDAVAGRHPDVDLVVVDVSVDPRWARERGVLATPTLIGLRDGREVFRYAGRRGADELEALFAGVGSGTRPAGVGGTDAALQAFAGTALVVAGLLTGPAWPLVAVGGAVLGVAALLWWRRR